jgi:RNA polymerase sigma-70 factor (ECF subfamily)
MLDRVPSVRPDPESAASALEVDRGIRACLGALAAPRRRAVTLHLLGYSLAETAEALGGTLKRSEHLIYRGLDDMRRCLVRKGIEP